MFDELKNQWGFSGFCAKARATTELAARLLLMVYNLWVLFVRFIVPHKHTEAKSGRRWFLLIAARLVQSGRQKEVQVSIRGGWAEQLRDGYLRLHEWIRTTAPQLKPVTPLPVLSDEVDPLDLELDPQVIDGIRTLSNKDDWLAVSLTTSSCMKMLANVADLMVKPCNCCNGASRNQPLSSNPRWLKCAVNSKPSRWHWMKPQRITWCWC